MTVSDASATASTDSVLAEVTRMIREILDEYGMDLFAIEAGSSFHGDLEMESIDLVTLAGMLTAEYGDDVNLAEFLADKDLDEVIGLTVGDVVDYVLSRIGRG
jgi:acyl carrier protein